MTASIHLVECTSSEVRDRIAAGWDTVVQAFGSTESHFAHLPLGTDFYQGSAVSERIARKLGYAFVAPTFPIGFAERLLVHPGSMSTLQEHLVNLVYDCCRSFAASGFRRIVLIVAHAGNCGPLGVAAERAQAAFPDVRIVCDSSREGFFAPVAKVGAELGFAEAAMQHAGHSETSLMLAIRPDLVHPDRDEGAPADWQGSSAEAGERYLEEWSDSVVRYVVTSTAG